MLLLDLTMGGPRPCSFWSRRDICWSKALCEPVVCVWHPALIVRWTVLLTPPRFGTRAGFADFHQGCARGTRRVSVAGQCRRCHIANRAAGALALPGIVRRTKKQADFASVKRKLLADESRQRLLFMLSVSLARLGMHGVR